MCTQARLADKEAAEREAARLEADNLQLAARLVEMKESEMQRMEDTNRMCEQMVRRLPSPVLPVLYGVRAPWSAHGPRGARV